MTGGFGERSTGAGLLLAAGLMTAMAVAWPPEVHPWSRAACQILAALSLPALVLLRCAANRPIPAFWLPLLPLLAGSWLAASCRARATDEAATLGTLLAAGLLGAALAGEARARRAIGVLLAGLGCAVAVVAMVQHHLLFPRQAEALLASNPAESGELLGRLLSGRAYGPFVLPAALGGFLALSLPFALAAAVSAEGRVRRAAGAAAVLLQGYALFLSRSLGALAIVLVALLLVLPLLAPLRWRRVLPALLLATFLAALVLVKARSPEFARPGTDDPLTLRVRNWAAAARMIRDHPILGTGPGSFGTFYPRYMRPGMNETRYAHNSYLQLAAGWGAWVVLPLGLLLLAFARAARRALVSPDERLLALAGGGAFLLHNAADFTAFLPGVAVPSALLLGLGIGEEGTPAGIAAPRSRARVRVAFLLAAALGASLGIHGVIAARSSALLGEARILADAGDAARAADRALRAARARPGDPDPQKFLAEMILARGIDDPDLRAAGEAAAGRALLLDPESAIAHYTRGLYHLAAGESAAAYRERLAAHLLYPLKSLYRTAPPSAPGGLP